MTAIGYALSSEEHEPSALVEHAVLAEEHGFSFALISDHFHPWIDRQGQSPFVWGVLGAIANATDAARRRHRRDVSDHPDPPGDRRPGRCDGSLADAGSLLSRRRDW